VGIFGGKIGGDLDQAERQFNIVDLFGQQLC